MPYVAGPFSNEHWLVTWGGTLPSGETWSNGIRMTPFNSDPVLNPLDTEGTAIANAVRTFYGACPIGVYTMLDHVKVNTIGIDGKYKYPITLDDIFAPISGSGGANLYPNQVALVLSWETGFNRGPAHTGRIYLPSPTTPLTANTDYIAPAAAHAVDVAGGAFIAALNAVNVNMHAAVMSRKSGAATYRAILTTRCGRVLDTQRRRRRSVPELYEL